MQGFQCLFRSAASTAHITFYTDKLYRVVETHNRIFLREPKLY